MSEFEWKTFSKILVDIQFGGFHIILKINRGCFTWLRFSRRLWEQGPHCRSRASGERVGHGSDRSKCQQGSSCRPSGHGSRVPEKSPKCRAWQEPREKTAIWKQKTRSRAFWNTLSAAVPLWTLVKCWILAALLIFMT